MCLDRTAIRCETWTVIHRDRIEAFEMWSVENGENKIDYQSKR